MPDTNSRPTTFPRMEFPCDRKFHEGVVLGAADGMPVTLARTFSDRERGYVGIELGDATLYMSGRTATALIRALQEHLDHLGDAAGHNHRDSVVGTDRESAAW